MIIYQIYPTQWSGLQQIVSKIPYFKEMGMNHYEIANLVFSYNGHKLIYNGQETGMINTVTNSREPETIDRLNEFMKLGMPYNEAKLTANNISRDNARQVINWNNNVDLTQYYKELCVSERDSKHFKLS
nr:MAG TPA: alpha,alpha-phosphotrehalase [Caudoviricetes sp.]